MIYTLKFETKYVQHNSLEKVMENFAIRTQVKISIMDNFKNFKKLIRPQTMYNKYMAAIWNYAHCKFEGIIIKQFEFSYFLIFVDVKTDFIIFNCTQIWVCICECKLEFRSIGPVHPEQ